MTAIYSLQDNTLTEQPAMEKPKKPKRKDYDLTGSMISAAMLKYETELAAYRGHVSQLRTIPAHESARSLWRDGQKVEEGKDYEVRESDWMAETEEEYNQAMYEAKHELTGPVPKVLTAFPLPVKSEDELWNAFIDAIATIFKAADREVQEIGIVQAAENAEQKMVALKQKYSLTKR